MPEAPARAGRRGAFASAPAVAPRRLVVAQLAFVGDMVFATPLLDVLRETWPAAEITVVGRPRALEILEDHPAVDVLLPYDKDRDAGPRGLLRLARALRALRPELFVGVSRSARTAMLGLFSGAREKVGFAGGPGRLLYGASPERDPTLPFAERALALARALGLSAARRPLSLHVGAERQRQAEERLRRAGWLGGRLVALAPGANYATKRWPERHWAALIDVLLAGGDLQPALYGGPAERALIERLRSGRERVLDRSTTGVGEMCAELSLARAALAGDSGPIHIARALGVPSVALFGPTSPEPVRDATPLVAMSRGLECQPCSPHGDARCPLGHHACLEELAVQPVLRELERVAKVGPAGR